MSLLEHARAALAAGLQPIPVAEDGSKRPDLPAWAEYQQRPVTDDDLTRWFTNGRRGIGIVTGAISGGLEMLEFEAAAVDEGIHRAFLDAADASGLGPLLDRIVGGYLEETPSGGLHLLYRCSETSGNTKLARRPTTTEERADEHDRLRVLIETRGEGGQVVVAPSDGPVHPTGRPWRLLQGGFATIATITPDERRAAFELARSFDAMPRSEAPSRPIGHRPNDVAGERPGDDFSARASWAEVLEPHGWTFVFQRGDTAYWRRPGKTAGISATTNHAGSGLLYVFSSSTPFEPERGYSPFAAFAVLNHAGNFEDAAHALADAGYGTGAHERREAEAFLDDVAAAPSSSGAPSGAPATPARWPDLDEFLDTPDAPYDWVVADLLEAGDRLIVTGDEGRGKSTLLRQLAVQLASGIHPFTGQPIDPVPTLLIDCENSVRQVRRKLRPLREVAGDAYRSGQLHVRVVGQAVDLTKRPVEDALSRTVEHFQPRAIFLGPLYKLAEGDPKDEPTARALASALDRLRAISGACLVIEAHTPYADGARSKRPIRPYGASLWSRWPEFGLYLAPDGTLETWRGPREERAWPSALERSAPWPWAPVAAADQADGDQWHGPTRCIEAIVHLLTETGEELSGAQLETRLRALGNSYRSTTIRQAAEQAVVLGQLTARTGPRSSRLFRLAGAGEDLLCG